MGGRTFSRDGYRSARREFVPDEGPATARAEEQARLTGVLDPLVDPAGFDVIRRSLLRLDRRPDGLWIVTVGCPMTEETRVDTTGSMGGNVDIAIKVLPSAYELCSQVLPGYDLQMATSVFGDIGDRFVLCRPQFEAEAEKIVEQLAKMVPERAGGDEAEDPHYGLFGGAFLTSAYINSIELKRYDFTVSDAPARDRLSADQLRRIYGPTVFDRVVENGFQISSRDLPSTGEVVQALLKQAHAFFLQVADWPGTTRFWVKMFGPERVVNLPSTELLPQVKAVIIGLTEGTLDLSQVMDFLRDNGTTQTQASAILRSVSNIPVGAQRALPNYGRQPKKGDLFRDKPDLKAKTNLWPIGTGTESLPPAAAPDAKALPPPRPDGIKWL